MKANRLIILLALLPQLASAQWSMVRFDEYNFFNRVVTATPDDAIVAGADPSGIGSFILRTNNGGSSWDSIVVNSPLNTYTISELFFTDVNNGFAGGINNNFQSLLKTSDNGSTWNEITPDPALILPINVISFVDPLNGFVSDETNLYKTIDGGTTWASSVPGFGLKDLVFSDMTHGYACGESIPNAVVMKTNDGGQTWTNMLSTAFQFFTSSSMQKLDVVNPDVVYCSGMYTNTIFRTIDGGISWDTITMSQIWGIQDYDFISMNEGHVLSTMGEIFGTTDGGQTWTLEYAVAGGAYGPSVFLVSISFAGTTGYVCGSNGLIKKYESTTGIETPGASDLFSFYPNPVSENGVLNIAGVDGKYDLQIYNQTGQLVISRDQMEAGETLKLNLSSGIYSIMITQNESRFNKKLVVVY